MQKMQAAAVALRAGAWYDTRRRVGRHMLEIIYEDAQLAVCVKPVGTAAQGEAPNAMPQQLAAQLGCTEIFPVHRLDQIVGGVMVYAKTQLAAAALSQQLQTGAFKKEYLAVLRGVPEQEEDTLCDVLYHDCVKNKTFVVKKKRPGARQARLAYALCQSVPDGADVLSLVRVQLFTGRTHQIRAQFASRKLPLLGDGKYGGGDNRCSCALWSYRLRFRHPQAGREMAFVHLPPDAFPWNLFSKEGL